MTSRLLFVSLTSLAIVASCSPVSDATISKSIKAKQEILNAYQIPWLELLNQRENNYLVFVYSETCGYCHDMLDEIIDFALSDILPTYFINTQNNEVPISSEYVTNISDINALSIRGTPTVIEVKEGVVISNSAGLDECLNYLANKRMS